MPRPRVPPRLRCRISAAGGVVRAGTATVPRARPPAGRTPGPEPPPTVCRTRPRTPAVETVRPEFHPRRRPATRPWRRAVRLRTVCRSRTEQRRAETVCPVWAPVCRRRRGTFPARSAVRPRMACRRLRRPSPTHRHRQPAPLVRTTARPWQPPVRPRTACRRLIPLPVRAPAVETERPPPMVLRARPVQLPGRCPAARALPSRRPVRRRMVCRTPRAMSRPPAVRLATSIPLVRLPEPLRMAYRTHRAPPVAALTGTVCQGRTVGRVRPLPVARPRRPTGRIRLPGRPRTASPMPT